jgi:hypothetical protein
MHILATALAAFIVLSATAGARLDWPITIQPLPSPAAGESGQPRFGVSDRGVVLSWIERSATAATLKFSTRTPTGWSEPRAVASGTDWFVNWADVPSVVPIGDDRFAAHWLQKSGPGTYAYDIRLSFSNDGGRTWTPSVKPHSDATETEHGFASLFALAGGGLGAVWLDGRAMKGGGHGGHGGGDMALQFGAFVRRPGLSAPADWKQSAEAPVDGRVCECCPTAAAVTSEGVVVAYRDRSADEVRDIHVVRLENGKWSAPAAVHADGWRIPACPVNGPALSARGRNVAMAWFTMKDGKGHAAVSFSKDAGRTFGSPIALADSDTLGRVDVALLPDGSAVASWIEVVEKRSELRIRRVEPGGARSAAVTVAPLEAGRSSGYPRLAVHGNELLLAWVAREKGLTVKTASARLPR